MPPLSPPLAPPTAAADVREGFAPAEATPLHRSLVALRVEGAGVVFAGAVLFADERAALLVAVLLCVAFTGAVELLNTAWPACVVTPAVEPLARVAAGCALLAAGVRWAWAGAVDRRVTVLVSRTAPLVVPAAARAGVAAGLLAGASAVDAAGAVAWAGAAVAAAAGPALGVAGVGAADVAGAACPVEAGGPVGVAGVPYPDGVHAIATPTSTTGTLNTPIRLATDARVRRTIAHRLLAA